MLRFEMLEPKWLLSGLDSLQGGNELASEQFCYPGQGTTSLAEEFAPTAQQFDSITRPLAASSNGPDGRYVVDIQLKRTAMPGPLPDCGVRSDSVINLTPSVEMPTGRASLALGAQTDQGSQTIRPQIVQTIETSNEGAVIIRFARRSPGAGNPPTDAPQPDPPGDPLVGVSDGDPADPPPTTRPPTENPAAGDDVASGSTRSALTVSILPEDSLTTPSPDPPANGDRPAPPGQSAEPDLPVNGHGRLLFMASTRVPAPTTVFSNAGSTGNQTGSADDPIAAPSTVPRSLLALTSGTASNHSVPPASTWAELVDAALASEREGVTLAIFRP